jgi:hypothetical protein
MAFILSWFLRIIVSNRCSDTAEKEEKFSVFRMNFVWHLESMVVGGEGGEESGKWVEQCLRNVKKQAQLFRRVVFWRGMRKVEVKELAFWLNFELVLHEFMAWRDGGWGEKFVWNWSFANGPKEKSKKGIWGYVIFIFSCMYLTK